MKNRCALVASLLLANVATAATITVPIDYADIPRIARGETDVYFTAPFALENQQVSLTFSFNTGVRVFRMTQQHGFYVVVRFDTNGSDIVPWNGPAQASLLDELGNPLGAPQTASTIIGSNKYLFGMGFHPDFTEPDFYGVRFDFTAPNAPDVNIVRSFFRLGSYGTPYGIGTVADTDSTLLLLLLAVALLSLMSPRTRWLFTAKQ